MILAAFALIVAGGQVDPGSPCPPEVVVERRIEGIFVDDFEGQLFFDGAKRIADLDFRARPRAWFDFNVVEHGKRFGITRREWSNRAYRVVGRVRERSRPGAGSPPRAPCGYGHMRRSETLLEPISIDLIEPLGAVR